MEEATSEGMDVQGKNGPPEMSVEVSLSDQHFLLNFIMGTYLGPDVYSDNPRCSASQRLAKGLTPYTSKNLGPSFLSTSQLESLYYYVLRNADSSLILKPNTLRMYLKGKMPFPSSGLLEDSHQFTSFFPVNIHEQKWYSASHEIVKGIVLIDDPVTSYVKEEELKRFRRLTGMDSLKIDKIESLSYHHSYREGQKEDAQNGLTSDEEMFGGLIFNGNCYSLAKYHEACEGNNKQTVTEHVTNENDNSSPRFQETYKRRRNCDLVPIPELPHVVSATKPRGEDRLLKRTCNTDGPAVMPLSAVPEKEECVSGASVTLTGTASRGICGPPIGVLDIGVSNAAYFFRIALPGVRKDYRQFSCEIESDGRVLLQGSISGGKIIKKRSQVFQMKYQRLCPPGPFSLAFALPGPVDPRLFSPNFRSDGIFEAVIIKH